MHRIRELLLIAILVVALTSCVHQNITLTFEDLGQRPEIREVKLEVPPSIPECGDFVLPDLGSIPELPVIQPMYMDDHEYIGHILIDHISSLMRYIDQSNSRINTEYQKYLRTCRN
jgi:hypothetical protein